MRGEALAEGGQGQPTARAKQRRGQGARRSARRSTGAILDFVERLAHVTVLDPACGSGNFLYVAIHMLLDLEKEVIAYAATRGLSLVPHVAPDAASRPRDQPLRPAACPGGDLDRLPAVDAPQRLQDARRPGAGADREHPLPGRDPRPLRPRAPARSPSGRRRSSSSGTRRFWAASCCARTWATSTWTRCSASGTTACRARPTCAATGSRRPAADRAEEVPARRPAGHQGIRGGANRKVLERIKETGDIFFAESDRDWVLDGANVHVSMVGFDDGEQTRRILDGKPVDGNPCQPDARAATQRRADDWQRTSACLSWATRRAAHSTSRSKLALEMLHAAESTRPSQLRRRRPLGQRARRYAPPARHVDHRLRRRHAHDVAARYERRLSTSTRTCVPSGEEQTRSSYRERWWIHVEPRPAMRQAIRGFAAILVTTTVSKHRLFVWFESPVLPDHQLDRLCPRRRLFLRRASFARPRGVGACGRERNWRRGRVTRRRRVSRRFRFRSWLAARRTEQCSILRKTQEDAADTYQPMEQRHDRRMEHRSVQDDT